MQLPANSISGLPIFSLAPPANPPDDYYLVVQNGVFRVTTIKGMCQAITPASFEDLGISEGLKIAPFVEFTGPKLSFAEHMVTVRFYQAVWKKHRSEALVVYHIHEGSPIAIAPWQQTVSSGHVSYAPFDYVCVPCRRGSVERNLPIEPLPTCEKCARQMTPLRYWGGSHSHGSMRAFASGTDVENEKTLPGVHLIYGAMDKALPDMEIVGGIVVNGHRFVLGTRDDLRIVMDLDDPCVEALSTTASSGSESFGPTMPLGSFFAAKNNGVPTGRGSRWADEDFQDMPRISRRGHNEYPLRDVADEEVMRHYMNDDSPFCAGTTPAGRSRSSSDGPMTLGLE